MGLFEFRVLSFGLCNAPATFQRAMTEMLAEEIRAGFVIVYLDDILVFSKTPEEHMVHLRATLEKLRQHRYYARLEKCEFNKSELKYLGFIVGQGCVKPDPAKVRAVADWPELQTPQHVRQFLGLTNYFRRFIQGYGRLAMPLNALLQQPNTKKGKPAPPAGPMPWGPVQREAFQGLKDALVSAPVLALPDPSKPFDVIADASDFAVGSVLLQDNKPVAFESRRLTDTERRYHTGDKELLGIVYALRKFRPYVLGRRFTVYTDHRPNTTVNDQVDIQSWSGRKARWAEFLQQYDCEIVYQTGRQNLADPISRRPDLMMLCVALTRSRTVALAQPGSIAQPESSVRTLGEGSSPPLPRTMAGGWRERVVSGYSDPLFLESLSLHGCVLKDGLWFKDDTLVIPPDQELRQHILHEVHDSPYCGHSGVSRTIRSLIRHGLWWPSFRSDARTYVRNCAMCQRNKVLPFSLETLLNPLPVPERLWQVATMDFITDLPLTAMGHDALLVIVDKLSKYCILIPTTKTAGAEVTADLVFDNLVCHHGMPEDILSDRDPIFRSKFWQQLHMRFGTSLTMSTAHRPQTDGQNERLHRTLEDMLRCYVNPMLDDWDRWISCAQFAINTAHVESMGSSPFYVMHGRHANTPLRQSLVDISDEIRKHLPRAPRAAELARTIEHNIGVARQHLLAAQERMKAVVDKGRQLREFEVGDEVLLSTKHLKLKGPSCKKLLPRYVGPFTVLQRIGPSAYKLKLLPSMKVHPVFNVSLLAPYRHDGRYQPPPPVLNLEGELEYEVSRILDHRMRGRGRNAKTEYKIRWLGQGPEHDTWEAESNLNCPEVLAEYKKFLGEAALRVRRQFGTRLPSES